MSLPTILVVDDSSTVRVRLRRILTNAGYQVAAAANGAEGITQAKELCPRLIILDIQMPDVDGYGVCDELKRMGEPWASLPIIFLTSLESHALALLGSEMGAYLQKPIRPDTLLNAVESFLRGSGPPKNTSAASTGGLCACDTMADRPLQTSTLSSQGKTR